MPIEREQGFLVFSDPLRTPRLGLESATLPLCIQECLDRPYSGVFGTPSFGFHETDLDCLGQLPHVQDIWFWDVALDNVDALYGLSKLRAFGVHPERPAVDFARLPTLRSLVWIHKPQDRGVDALAALETLAVWHFAPRSKSFADLPTPLYLTELEIFWANPATLHGLKPNPNLRRLKIARCRNLESLALLPELYPALEHLVVEACGRIPPEEGARIAAQLPALDHAFVNRLVPLGTDRVLNAPNASAIA